MVEAEVKRADDAERLVIAALVEASLSIVAEAVVRLVIVPVEVVNCEIVPEAEVRSAMVVVANVVLPKTTRLPCAVRFPCTSARKFRFSIHVEPFQ